MSITRLALKLALPVPHIEDFESYLFIGPHPDDIEIGAGATVEKLARLGKRICFLICLDGRYGSETVPPEELIALRKEESIKSAAVLGVSDVRFLGLSDGGFYSFDELYRGIAEVIGDFKPELVFAPDCSSRSECHNDHLNVGDAARRIACNAPYKGVMSGLGADSAPVKALAVYMTAKPNRLVKTAGIKTQLEAVACHESQFPKNGDAFHSLKLYLTLRSVDFGIRSLSRAAEGFYVLSATQMHCLPEM